MLENKAVAICQKNARTALLESWVRYSHFVRSLSREISSGTRSHLFAKCARSTPLRVAQGRLQDGARGGMSKNRSRVLFSTPMKRKTPLNETRVEWGALESFLGSQVVLSPKESLCGPPVRKVKRLIFVGRAARDGKLCG